MSNGRKSDMLRSRDDSRILAVERHPLYVSEKRGVKVNGGSFLRPPGEMPPGWDTIPAAREALDPRPSRGRSILEGRSNSSKTRMLDRNCPHPKEFRKSGLTPPKGCATRGASLACESVKWFIFNMFHISQCSSPGCTTWGQFPEKPKKARVPGYPHLWRSLWITPRPLWKPIDRTMSHTDQNFSIS